MSASETPILKRLFILCLFDRDNAQYIIEQDSSHKANLHLLSLENTILLNVYGNSRNLKDVL